MPTFFIGNCETEVVNFFSSGKYFTPSYSQSWSTLVTPDVEGITTPVYLQVLDKFNVPVDSSGGLPPGGTLPGIDIKNMDAIQAIRLSLAEALVLGEWWEVREDGNGGVFFEKVFDNGAPSRIVTLDIRLCIPAASKTNDVDMVIVHGYNPPPERFIIPFENFDPIVPAGTGPINPATVNGAEKVFTVAPAEFVGTCHQRLLQSVVYKSYVDPVETDISFGGQEANPFYDVKAFEKLVGYVHRITGMPESPEDAARINYSFNPTTPWYFEIDYPSFSRASIEGCTGELPQDSTIVYFEGKVEYQVPNFSDRYGTQWPLITKPTGVFYTGNKLLNLTTVNNQFVIAYVDPITEFNSLSGGANWVYTIPGVNQFDINIFYQPQVDPDFWETVILEALSLPAQIRYSDGRSFDVSKVSSDPLAVAQYASAPGFGPATSALSKVLGIGGNLGYLVNKMWIAFEVKRPCMVIEDKGGDALGAAADLKIEYAPIIVRDTPSPIAYKHKDAGTKIVDQARNLQDNDPTTCQNFEDTDTAIMQDLSVGNVTEIHLPFCVNGDECLKVAETLFDYMLHEDVTTFTLTCGPDDEPVLGAAVTGFSADLRIESINYSYSDGSAYTVEVTLGPVFANIGSWQVGPWQRSRTDVTRQGIVIWTAGDGVNYRVYVQGLGEFNAINGINDIHRIGEHVTVNIVNAPIEA